MISPNDALQVSTEACSFKRMEMGGDSWSNTSLNGFGPTQNCYIFIGWNVLIFRPNGPTQVDR